jgi:hypothetical protein
MVPVPVGGKTTTHANQSERGVGWPIGLESWSGYTNVTGWDSVYVFVAFARVPVRRCSSGDVDSWGPGAKGPIWHAGCKGAEMAQRWAEARQSGSSRGRMSNLCK